MSEPTLHFLCGRVAAGKTTFSRQLAAREGALLICEDIWLQRLYPVEIRNFNDYLRYSQRLKAVLAPHVQQLLQAGLSVVMDFPANVPAARAWMRSIFEAAGARHMLHYLDTAEPVCRRQLALRNRELPEGSVLLSEQDFQQVNALFRPPQPAEGFTLVVYQRGPGETAT